MDALDQQQAVMAGVARYQEWRRMFLAEFREAVEKNQLKMAWAMMPDAMKEMVKRADPAGYEQMRSVLES